MNVLIHVDNAIRIFEADLPEQAVQIIEADLTLPNPKWEQVETYSRSRRRNFQPEFIRFYKRKSGVLIMPRGYIHTLRFRLKEVAYTIVDKTRLLPPVSFSFKIALHPYQVSAVRDVMGRRFGVFSPEDFTEFLKMLKMGTLRLNRMVEDFLLVVKIDSGELPKEIDFREACISPLEIVTRFALVREEIKKNKDITLSIEVPDESPYLFIHPPHFEDIVARLFDNACKFSPAGAAITISSHTENDRYIFSVADNGNGIPLDKQDRLFQKFYQVDRESQEQQGAGLGLYIAKKLAELNKCTLWCESDQGKGAAFYLSIPRKS